MKVTRYLIMTAMIVLSQQASADMYKCNNHGITAYQARPCTNESSQTIIEQKAPPKSEIEAGEKYEEGISLSPIYVKKDHVDSIGSQWISYKVTVTNNTDSDRKLYITYKGIDRDGFNVKDIVLNGTIPAHASKSLTDKTVMDVPQFNRIQTWVLDH
jgi:hypothetical protein